MSDNEQLIKGFIETSSEERIKKFIRLVEGRNDEDLNELIPDLWLLL